MLALRTRVGEGFADIRGGRDRLAAHIENDVADLEAMVGGDAATLDDARPAPRGGRAGVRERPGRSLPSRSQWSMSADACPGVTRNSPSVQIAVASRCVHVSTRSIDKECEIGRMSGQHSCPSRSPLNRSPGAHA